jgi:hypothetical protein
MRCYERKRIVVLEGSVIMVLDCCLIVTGNCDQALAKEIWNVEENAVVDLVIYAFSTIRRRFDAPVVNTPLSSWARAAKCWYCRTGFWGAFNNNMLSRKGSVNTISLRSNRKIEE